MVYLRIGLGAYLMPLVNLLRADGVVFMDHDPR